MLSAIGPRADTGGAAEVLFGIVHTPMEKKRLRFRLQTARGRRSDASGRPNRCLGPSNRPPRGSLRTKPGSSPFPPGCIAPPTYVRQTRHCTRHEKKRDSFCPALVFSSLDARVACTSARTLSRKPSIALKCRDKRLKPNLRNKKQHARNDKS